MITELTPTAWVHNLDPFALSFGDGWGIRWYGLAYFACFVITYLIIQKLILKGNTQIKLAFLPDFATYAALGTLIGGRLGYVVFYSPELLLDFRTHLPFWGVLAINEGGMASHGGMIGITVACLLFAKKHKIDAFHLGDFCAFGATIGIFFGRIANFINAELVGRAVQSYIPWAVKFPQDIHYWPRDPDGFFKLKELTPLVVEHFKIDSEKWNRWLEQMNFDSHSREYVYNTLEQIVTSIQSNNEAVRSALAPYLISRHPSQIYAALLEGLFLFIILLVVWMKPRKPGIITGIFLVGYAIVRIFNEQFRMPDAHIGYQLFDLTRGQWLSIGLLFISLIVLYYLSRRQAPKLVGWFSISKPNP